MAFTDLHEELSSLYFQDSWGAQIGGESQRYARQLAVNAAWQKSPEGKSAHARANARWRSRPDVQAHILEQQRTYRQRPDVQARECKAARERRRVKRAQNLAFLESERVKARERMRALRARRGKQ